MKCKIIVSTLAKEDLIRISKYLSKSKFEKIKNYLKEKQYDLKSMPRMYPRIYYEKNTKTDFRKIVCENYIIIYKIQKNQITITKIVSEKENYLKPKLLEIC
ncbi:MAG: type II toxin-antitoxin system RelE/ParE family toxin [Clostridia bacterium]|nr:type II toxin-antitoxin system RelE/ParE family toxin [Clostridia bacterium]